MQTIEAERAAHVAARSRNCGYSSRSRRATLYYYYDYYYYYEYYCYHEYYYHYQY